jgi:HK97 family phage major capsid protein
MAVHFLKGVIAEIFAKPRASNQLKELYANNFNVSKITIANEGDLDTFVNLTADEVNKLKGEVTRLKNDLGGVIGVQKSGFLSSSPGDGKWSDEQTEEFGGLIRKLAKREIQSVGSLDKGYITKAALGTPLTADAVTGSSVTGEFYVRDILRLAESRSYLRPYVKVVKMTDRIGHYPKENAVPEFTYVATDGGTQAEGTMTFATAVELRAYTYATWVSLTESLIEDSLYNLGAYFAEKIAGALARKFDYEFLRGTGSPTTGILSAAGTNVVLTDDSTFDSLDEDCLFNMVEALDTDAKRDGAMWIGHSTIFDKIWRLQDANGQFHFRDIVERGTTSKLLGYPWITSGQMPSSSNSASNTGFFLLGNPNHFIFGDRIALEIKVFDQMASTVEVGEVIFRARFRAAFAQAQAGAWAVLKTAA